MRLDILVLPWELLSGRNANLVPLQNQRMAKFLPFKSSGWVLGFAFTTVLSMYLTENFTLVYAIDYFWIPFFRFGFTYNFIFKSFFNVSFAGWGRFSLTEKSDLNYPGIRSKFFQFKFKFKINSRIQCLLKFLSESQLLWPWKISCYENSLMIQGFKISMGDNSSISIWEYCVSKLIISYLF